MDTTPPYRVATPLGSLQDDLLFWTVIVTIVAAASFFSFWFTRRRHELWRDFATAHGFRYSPSTAPRVEGNAAGRAFTLELSKDSSDRGPFGIQVITMRLATRTGIDLDFDITNEGVVATAIREATGDEDIVHVEEEAFDNRTTIHCAEPNVVASYLTPMRKAEILTLMAKCRSCDVHVTQNEVAVTERTVPKTVEALSDRLSAMLACADALDA